MKQIYKTFFIYCTTLILGLLPLGADAQVNIALTGTASHSGGGTAGFAATNYNDNIIAAPGGSPWGWVSASNTSGLNAWIQYTWTSPQSFNKIKFYNVLTTTRCLTGGTLQYWTGSAWANITNFSTTAQNEFEVTFTPTTSTRLRLVNMVITGSQNSNPNFREIQVFNSKPNDAGITSFYKFTCEGSQSVSVNLTNYGNNRLDSVNIHWTINGVAQTSAKWVRSSLADTMGAGTSRKITIGSGTFNANTNYALKIWTSMPNAQNDSVNGNDTLLSSFMIYAVPNKPTANDVVVCGAQFPALSGTADAGSTLNWFIKGNRNRIIAQGASAISSDKITPGMSYRVLAQAFNGGADSLKNSLTQTWSYTGGTAALDKGVYFDLVTTANVMLERISTAITDLAANNNSYDVEVFYKFGTYLGSETNASKWTSLGITRITNTTNSNGTVPAIPAMLKINPVLMYKDSVYGFYIVVKNGGINLRNCAAQTTSSIVSDFLTLKPGAISLGTFASNGITQGYRTESNFFFKAGCVSDTAGANLSSNPTPTGADLDKGTVFKGIHRSGSVGAPDVVASNDTITYSLTPPTGYSNSGYGTTWTIKSVTAKTLKGSTVAGSHFFQQNPGSANGVIGFRPSMPLTDSTIKLSIVIGDLGPYFCDSTIERHIFVAPRGVPKFVFAPNSVCAGEFVEFTNNSTVSSGAMTYKWYFGNGDSSDNTNPIYKWTAYGTYNIKLRVKTDPYGYETDTTITIVVKEVPNVNFSRMNACEGDSISLTNTSTYNSGNVNYTWQFGDGQGSNRIHPKHLYNAAGGYDVTLKAEGNGCESEITRRVVQFARPDANFIVENNDCNSKEVTFKSTSTIAMGNMGHVWEFGDGSRGTVANPLHVYQSFGTKQVKLKVNSEFGCADSTTMSFTLKESPQADFSVGSTCANDPVVFSNNTTEPAGSVTIYKWYFGDGDSATGFGAAHKYKSLGTKLATLLASSDNGCFTTISKSFTVMMQPVADFSSENVCSGDPVKFVNRSKVDGNTNLDHKWIFGDGDTTSDKSPSHLYTTSTTTTYPVTLVSTIPGGCADSVVKQVKIFALPNCNFAAQNTGHRTWIFTPAGLNDVTYHWLFGDGSFSTAQIPTYKYPANGDFKVTLIATTIEGGCICSKTLDLSVNLGIKEQSSNTLDLTIYPNPNKGEFSIHVLSNPGKYLNIDIYNVLGEKVKTVETNLSTSGIYDVDMGELNSGVYLVRVDNGKEITTMKVTVSR